MNDKFIINDGISIERYNIAINESIIDEDLEYFTKDDIINNIL